MDHQNYSLIFHFIIINNLFFQSIRIVFYCSANIHSIQLPFFMISGIYLSFWNRLHHLLSSFSLILNLFFVLIFLLLNFLSSIWGKQIIWCATSCSILIVKHISILFIVVPSLFNFILSLFPLVFHFLYIWFIESFIVAYSNWLFHKSKIIIFEIWNFLFLHSCLINNLILKIIFFTVSRVWLIDFW